jgi:hypothetical protein
MYFSRGYSSTTFNAGHIMIFNHDNSKLTYSIYIMFKDKRLINTTASNEPKLAMGDNPKPNPKPNLNINFNLNLNGF